LFRLFFKIEFFFNFIFLHWISSFIIFSTFLFYEVIFISLHGSQVW
jgi:hypothetical protein